jgi:hypothetical protein
MVGNLPYTHYLTQFVTQNIHIKTPDLAQWSVYSSVYYARGRRFNPRIVQTFV